MAPLRSTGQLQEVEGRVRLTSHRGDRITVVPTPGHTVGHQSLVARGGGDEIVVTGDVLVHAVQLANPDVAYRFETDEARARDSRRHVPGRARRGRSLLATAHLTRPFVPVR